MISRDGSLTGNESDSRAASCPLSVRLVYGIGEAANLGGGAPEVRETGTPEALLSTQSSFQLNVEFSVSARQNVLFGPSGAGKSTLLRLLAGLTEPWSGSIILGGVPLVDANHSVPPGRRRIGYLTQEPALFPHLSVEQNVAYGVHALRTAARRERVAAMLSLFSLESLSGRMPLNLSGGERQRVALARALAPDPSLLLLDEPFAALDAPLRAETTAALNEHLAACETTVLTVSHDVAEVYSSGAQVLLLEAGRITAQGPSHEVLTPHRERLLRQLGATS